MNSVHRGLIKSIIKSGRPTWKKVRLLNYLAVRFRRNEKGGK